MKEQDGQQLDYNRSHPELKKGEMFLKNLEYRGGNRDNFNKIPFKTKRWGKIAFTPFGFNEKMKDGEKRKTKIQIQGQRPVFVKIWEYKEKGLDMNAPFKDYLNKNFSKHTKEEYYEQD